MLSTHQLALLGDDYDLLQVCGAQARQRLPAAIRQDGGVAHIHRACSDVFEGRYAGKDKVSLGRRRGERQAAGRAQVNAGKVGNDTAVCLPLTSKRSCACFISAVVSLGNTIAHFTGAHGTFLWRGGWNEGGGCPGQLAGMGCGRLWAAGCRLLAAFKLTVG